MKRVYKIIGFAFLVFLLVGCKQAPLDLYDANPSIYFVNSEESPGSQISFGYTSGYVRDSLVTIAVRTTGAPVDYDRPYNLRVLDHSTLRAGVDYEFLNPNFSIPADAVTHYIRIRLLRTDAMALDTLGLYLEIFPNEYFSDELHSRVVGTGDQQEIRYYTKRYLLVDDIVGVPWFWNPAGSPGAPIFIGYLGQFSARKLQLMIGRFNLDPDEVTAVGYEPPITMLLAWASGMQAYLNEMAENGTPVLEADGSAMVMGQYAQ